ncbi:MAG: PfkB family carbohydrate kinase [Candidatus Krumholzibacteriales bacterium]
MKGFNLAPEDFRDISRSWSGIKVVVFGDMILDEYIYGRTGRVSREAPVVIVEYDGTSYCPGGGANAAANISALGGTGSAVGITGEDSAGKRLRAELEKRSVSVKGLISSENRGTVLKTRIMAGDFHAQRQQIVRIDRENKQYIPGKDQQRVLSAFSREISDAGAVILSDYNQKLLSAQVISDALEMIRERGIPVFVDSRFRLNEFSGVTGATPNEVELSMTAGIELAEDGAVDEAALAVMEKLSLESLIVTRGSCGMSLYRPGKEVFSVPVVGSRAATDVTGAGDTVVAVVALAAAAGADMKTAMMTANAAASVVVMKRGTGVASPGEIVELLKEHCGDQTG